MGKTLPLTSISKGLKTLLGANRIILKPLPEAVPFEVTATLS
jgi:hypothetical protein